MQALILAAGYGTRLRPVFPDIPKVMAPIHGRPFLWYLLSHMKRNGITEVVIAVSVLSSTIKDFFSNGKEFGLKINYSETAKPMGTAGEIKSAEKLLQEEFFVINGDTFFPQEYAQFYKFHQQKKRIATMSISRTQLSSTANRVIFEPDGKITGFIQEPTETGETFVNAGLYFFNKMLLSTIPSGKFTSLENDIFPNLISEKELYCFPSIHPFIDIGTPAGYKKAKQYFTHPAI